MLHKLRKHPNIADRSTAPEHSSALMQQRSVCTCAF
jgi:hypothetical protein